jgi:hypothetical protein
MNVRQLLHIADLANRHVPRLQALPESQLDKLSSILCHPPSTPPTLLDTSTVEALLTPLQWPNCGFPAHNPSTKVCLPQSCRLLRIEGDGLASRAPISIIRVIYDEC